MKKLIAAALSMALAAQLGIAALADVSYMADFETTETKFGKSTTYSGFKNSAADYSDSITPEWVSGEGTDGSTGLKITYKAATWYSGEIFFPIPASWSNGEGAEYLAFDCKGKGTVKLSLSTGSSDAGTLTNGTRYEYKISVDTSDEWQHISIPLSSFVHSGNGVNITEIGCVTFQAGENGNLNNNSADTKAMTAEELTAKAKTGSIVFDNMELTDDGSGAAVDPTEPPAATPEPEEKTRVIDFDNYSLSHKQTWAGFKNNDGDYNDYIKTSTTENGKEGRGIEIEYRAASWYAGESFLEIPSKWDIESGAKYLEFEANGKGIIKLALETGNVINGKRYERRIDIDTNGNWRKFSIPLEEFKNGAESVALSEVVGISFKAVESANLNNNADETKAMTAEELLAVAKTGSVVIDNMALCDESSLNPVTEVKLSQDGEELAALGDAADGEVAVNVSMSGYNGEQKAVIVAALYSSGILEDVSIAQGGADGEYALALNVEDAQNKTAKVFIFDSFGSMVPLRNAEVFE